MVLLVSGGHSLLVALEAPGSYRVLGATVDDAAGEAFDKVARYLGLGYPGGPEIDRLAASGDPASIRFPRATTAGAFDFSFSGLKTAVVSYVRAHPEVANEDVAASFQEAVVDVLVQKSLAAAEEIGAQGACLAGGVAANTLLRARFCRGLRAARPRLVPAEPGHVHRQRRHDRRRRATSSWSAPGRRRSTPAPSLTCRFAAQHSPDGHCSGRGCQRALG